ncbi:MAG: hypothetical protein CL602_14830 [Alteromonas sp.]|nr:hypothetical protein [Alteromonas sp.]
MYKETALSRKWRRLNNGNSTRDCNAIQPQEHARSKKPSHFCKGLNDGASTRDRTRDTRIFNANHHSKALKICNF